MDPYTTLTPPTVALRAEARRVQGRGIGLIVVILCSFVHYYYHDDWWDSPEGAVAYVAESVLLVVAAATLARLRFAMLVLAHQICFAALLIAILETYGMWREGPLVVQTVWDTNGDTYAEPDSRLYVRPYDSMNTCYGGLDYRIAGRAAHKVVARAAVALFGTPPENYHGPIPTHAEASVLVAEAPNLSVPTITALELAIDEVSLPRNKWHPQIEWRPTGRVAVVPIGGGGVLVSWGDGDIIDLYDAASRWRVASWIRDGHTAKAVRSRPLPWTDNALWLRQRWLHRPTTAAAVAWLVDSAQAHQIGTLYPYVGSLRPGGRFGWRYRGQIKEYDPEIARRFFQHLREAPPGEPPLVSSYRRRTPRVYPWIGGVLGEDVFPEDPRWRADFVAQAHALVALGADGVHVRIESMPEATPGYLDLLRELSVAVDGHVSVAAYPPPTPLHPVSELHWSTDFLRLVCEVSEEVSVMSYGTTLEDPAAYSNVMAGWTREIEAALSPLSRIGGGHDGAGAGCRWRIGVPTYAEDTAYHSPGAETLSAALDGVIAGYRYDGGDIAAPGFTGLALSSSWMITAEEWAELDARWGGYAPVDVWRIDGGY